MVEACGVSSLFDTLTVNQEFAVSFLKEPLYELDSKSAKSVPVPDHDFLNFSFVYSVQ